VEKQMSKYIKKVTLPNVPKLTEEQSNKVKEYFNQNISKAFITIVRPDRFTYTDDKIRSDTDVAIDGFYYIKADQLLKKLFDKQNVTQEFLDLAGVQAIVNVKEIQPHSDDGRCINLIYNLSGLANTVFYAPKNPVTFTSGRLYDSNEIYEVENHQLELHQWYFLNTYEIHSVKNVNDPRISISISISQEFDNFDQACAEIERRLFCIN
jgi:hypothetical protein